jgi:hypothetical protein
MHWLCGARLRTQGVSSVGMPVDTPSKLARLWAHEALRVFHDRWDTLHGQPSAVELACPRAGCRRQADTLSAVIAGSSRNDRLHPPPLPCLCLTPPHPAPPT